MFVRRLPKPGLCPRDAKRAHRRAAGGQAVSRVFDVAFVSCAGVTLEEGLTTARRPLADVIAAARAGAQRTVALIDSTKFGRASLLTIMGADEPDLIITDPALERDVASAYVAAGVALEILSTKEAA